MAIYIENTEIFGFEAAVRGMRNPLNSWHLSDSTFNPFVAGPNDLALMKKLSAAGPDHGKFLRMINVTMDITAPLYWWKEADTYAVGKVQNSCSTMHKIHSRPLTMDDFSHEHLTPISRSQLDDTISLINFYRRLYNDPAEAEHKKEHWHQMIQLLPSSYNQRRTVQLNYAVLKNMYHARKNHKLDEWHHFCDWAMALPYFEEVCVNDRP